MTTPGDETLPTEVDEEERRHRIEQARAAAEQDLVLRARYANGLFRHMTSQLTIANAVFVLYAWLGRRWDVPARVVDVWLTATVVHVVAVVAVVTQSLFPARRPDT
jgi:hypothetical protein